MSRTIEQKVVEMRFDNSNFEKNVSTSMETLNKLQETINKTTSGNSFANLGKAADSLNFSGLTATIQTVSEKFSWLEQVAIGALRNIGANIEQHLVQALKNVTVAQVGEGFSKYGIMNEATQTILSAISGDERYDDVDKLEYVEGILEKLAWFSDETSYGLTDMTDNVAKFTAAGLSLDDSADAMMGISNWAALSGQNARVAARAYYQLSQAMGSGSIKLLDWKSIENANMGTQEVKELLLEYGALHGELQKIGEGKYLAAGIDAAKLSAEQLKAFTITYKNFRDHLTEEQWLTGEVFIDAMGEYASYSNALYRILQNEENSINTASELMGYIDRALKKSEETGRSIEDIMMQDYKINIMVEDENGGLESALAGVTELGIKAMKMSQQARTWQQVVDSITDAASTQWMYIFQNIFGNVEEATSLFTNLANYFYTVFVDPLWDLRDLLMEWKDIGGRSLLFEGDESALENLKKALTGLIEAINVGMENIFPTKTAQELFNITYRFREWTKTLIISEEQSKKISKAVSNFLYVIKQFGKIVGSVFGAVKRIAGQVFDAFKQVFNQSWVNEAGFGFKRFFGELSHGIIDFFSNLKLSEGALDSLKTIFEAVKRVVSAVSDLFGALGKKIGELNASGKIKNLAELLGGKFLEVLLWIPEKIAAVVSAFVDFIGGGNGVADFLGKIGTAFGKAKDFIAGFVETMLGAEKGTGIFKTIANAIKDLVESIKNSSLFKTASENVGAFFDKLKGFFSENLTYEKGVEVFNSIKEAAESLGNTLKTFGENVWDGLTKAISAIKKFLGIEEKQNETMETTRSMALQGNDISKKGEGLGIGPVGSRSSESITILEQFNDTLTRTASAAETVSSSAETLTGVLSKVKDKITKLWDSVKKFFEGIKDTGDTTVATMESLDVDSSDAPSGFANFVSTIGGYLKEAAPTVLKALALIKSLKLIGGMGGAFSGIETFLDKLGKAANNFAKGYKKMGKAEEIKAIGKAFLQFAGAVGILAVVAIGISQLVDEGKDLSGGLTVIGIISAIILAVIGTALKLSKEAKAISIFGNAKNGGGLGGAFLGFAVAVGLLAILAVKLSELAKKGSEIWKGLAIVGAIAGGLIVFNVLSGVAQKLAGGKIQTGLLSTVGAIVVIVYLAKKITELVKEGVHLYAGFEIIKQIAQFLLYFEVISALSQKLSGKKNLSAGIWGIVGGIAALTALALGVAYLIQYLPPGSLDVATGIIGGIGLVLTGMLLLLSSPAVKSAAKLDKVVKDLMVIVGAISALTLLVAGIAYLQTITGPEGILVGGAVILGISGILTLLVLLFSSPAVKSAAKLEKVVKQLLPIVAAISILAAVVAGIALLSTITGPEAITQAGFIVAGMAVVLGGLATLLSQKFINPVQLSAVAGPMVVLSAALLVLSAALAVLSYSVSQNGWESLAIALGAIVIALVALAGTALLVAPVSPVLLALAGGVALLGAAALEFAFAGQIMVDTIITLAENAVLLEENLGRSIIAICDAIIEASPKITEAITSLLTAIVAGIVGFFANIWEMITGFFAEIFPKLGGWLSGVWTDIKNWFSGLWTGLGDWLSETWTKVKNWAKDLPTKIGDWLSERWTGIKNWFSGLWTSLGEWLSETWTNIKNWFSDTATKIWLKGGELIDNLWDGVKSAWDAVKNFFKGIWDSIITTIKNVFTGKGEEGKEGGGLALGENLIQGIKDGILATWEKVKGAITGVANAVLKFFGISWEIKSPSKAMKRMGGYLMEGAAIGIKDGEGMATDAATHAADSVTNAMGEALSNINDVLADDSFQPTITPVMDLSQIQNGTYAMGNLLRSYDNYTMQAAVAASYNPYQYADGTLKVDAQAEMSDSIGRLEQKFDEMLYKLGKIRVVLDSGTLVGELVDPMDEALGRKAVYVGRGM